MEDFAFSDVAPEVLKYGSSGIVSSLIVVSLIILVHIIVVHIGQLFQRKYWNKVLHKISKLIAVNIYQLQNCE